MANHEALWAEIDAREREHIEELSQHHWLQEYQQNLDDNRELQETANALVNVSEDPKFQYSQVSVVLQCYM